MEYVIDETDIFITAWTLSGKRGEKIIMNTETSSQCVFCRILADKETVAVIYEDESVIVFPVLEPVNPGHVIVVSKQHAPLLTDLDEDIAAHAMRIARRIAEAIRRSGLKCDAINLYVADGEAAGQEVPHFHLHVYPRFNGDGFGFKYDKSKHFVPINRQQMDETAEKIKKHL
jgi:histidine triad (HIT) family protein